MTTWTVTPNTGVYINESNGEITFPKNTSDKDIKYEIKCTTDDNCTGVTTYTIPKCNLQECSVVLSVTPECDYNIGNPRLSISVLNTTCGTGSSNAIISFKAQQGGNTKSITFAAVMNNTYTLGLDGFTSGTATYSWYATNKNVSGSGSFNVPLCDTVLPVLNIDIYIIYAGPSCQFDDGTNYHYQLWIGNASNAPSFSKEFHLNTINGLNENGVWVEMPVYGLVHVNAGSQGFTSTDICGNQRNVVLDIKACGSNIDEFPTHDSNWQYRYTFHYNERPIS